MTILFIDTEFNSHRGQLISLALVDQYSKREFYGVLPYNPQDLDPWVEEHVIPVLHAEPIGLAAFQTALREFLMDTGPCVHIVADWPTDLEHFCWALITGPGQRIDTPLLTMEVRRDIDSTHSIVPHNALFDARALRRAYYDRKP